MTTYNHAYTLAFAVPGSNYEDDEECLRNERDRVIAALEKRIDLLRTNPHEFLEALEGFDTFEE